MWIFRIGILLSVGLVIIALFFDRKSGGVRADRLDQTSSFRNITASEQWVADSLIKRKKGTLYKFFFFGLLIDAFFVIEAFHVISSGNISFVIVAIGVVLVHSCLVYAMKRKVNEVKNGEYTVMTGTVTEKFGTFTGRCIVYYFRVKDERGVEEVYQISHRPSYRKAEVGSRCMVFKYDSLKNNPNKYPNRPVTLGMDVVLM